MKTKIFILLLFWSTVFQALSASPNTIRVQGRITDKNGQPRKNAAVELKFEVYSALEGGVKLWPVLPADGSGMIGNIPTNDSGLFQTDLGPFSDTFFMKNGGYFLQIYVNDFGYQALTPRQAFTMVPFAMFANSADKAVEAGTLPAGTVTSAMIKDGEVTSDDIKDHTIQYQDLQLGAVGLDALSTEVLSKLIPKHAVLMFAGQCPQDGWAPFSQMDDRFPRGVKVYNEEKGGTDNFDNVKVQSAGGHNHTIPAHSHHAGSLVASGPGDTSGHQHKSGGTWAPTSWLPTITLPVSGKTAETSLTTDNSGEHTHTLKSDDRFLPPYLGIVFCEKL